MTETPRRPLWRHALLAPLGLGVAACGLTLLGGQPPSGALEAGAWACALAAGPCFVAVAGWRRANRRLARGALLAAVLEVLLASWVCSPGRTDLGAFKLDAATTQARLRYASQTAFDEVLRVTRAVAAQGPRQTGSPGLEATLEVVLKELRAHGWAKSEEGALHGLAAPPGRGVVRRTNIPVLVPRDEGSSLVLGDGPAARRLPAYALLPNLIQPCATPEEGLRAPLVYLGFGRDEDLEGRDVQGKLAVFEFASGEAWLEACEHGAAGAIFLEAPDGAGETVRQADRKYLALVPLDFPRVYVRDEEGASGAEGVPALVRAAAREGRGAVLHSRMKIETVAAPVLEALVPGAKSAREILVMAHADARAIAPALSYGGQEAFGIGAWLALFDYFAQHPPAFSLRFVLLTGHWQGQAAGRAYAYALKEAMGEQIALALGVDLNPESDALILTDESVADTAQPSHFGWLKKLLFTVNRQEPAWLDQIEALSERQKQDRGKDPSKYVFYGGRPTMPGNQWRVWLAPLDRWPPSSQSASHPTANQMFEQIGGLSLAFKTCEAYRQRHFTCRDRVGPWLKDPENLRPQVELTFALLGALADLDPQVFPVYRAFPFHLAGGYNRIELQVLRWRPEILWYEKKMPPGQRTFAVLAASDGLFFQGRSYAYWPRPVAPSRYIHRTLQCLQTLYVQEVDAEGHAEFTNVYCRTAQSSLDALAFTLDGRGRLTHAFDQGMHGDAEFRMLDRTLAGPDTRIQVPIFPCGALSLFSLVDPGRLSVDAAVENEYVRQSGARHDQDSGEIPFLPIQSVREAETHTEADSFSWVQYRQTGMVFLKPGQRCEVLAGALGRKPMLFNDDPELRAAWTEEARLAGVSVEEIAARHTREAIRGTDGGASPAAPASSASGAAEPAASPGHLLLGFRVAQGEERRLGNTTRLSGQQLARLTRQRLAAYAERHVRSPEADLYQARADKHAASAQASRAAGHSVAAGAEDALAWSAQAQAYRGSFRLLLDVVSTSVFYFVLLVPFGYLIERLVFPQSTLVRTALVAALVFLVFAGLLYFFHPGFHLASNVFVTVVMFLIVVLTLPALLIILARGTALALEPGALFRRRHVAGAERWGVLGAALSLAVSNMRRRALRTTLTLSTITLLVTALVLLTSTSADTYFYREAWAAPKARYRGVQVLNARNHTHGMSEETARLIEKRYGSEALVVRRGYFSPGYECTVACYAFKRTPAGGPSAGVAPWKLLDLRGAVALDARENEVSRLDLAVSSGRFFRPDDVRACLLSEETARRRGLAVGDTVRSFGEDLELVGLLHSATVDRDVVDLSGKPLTPIAFYRPILAVDDPDHLLAGETLFVPLPFVQKEEAVHMPVFSVVVVPHPPAPPALLERTEKMRAWMREAREESLGALEARLKRASQGELNDEEIARLLQAPGDSRGLEEVAAFNLERLALRRIAESCAEEHARVDVFVSQPAPPWQPEASGRVELLQAFPHVSLQSGAFLTLPFLIAFLMLLAIMLGGVYERRREIYIFSAVGLAPGHVAAMFLAEALVYAGIASVLGYFLGIILLDVFQRAGLLPANFYPNYFGKAVVWSAGLATGASVLSALYPMWIAARMVNPSLERVWRIETQPEGARWRIPLPFVAHGRGEVLGVLKFVHDFLDFHRGERSGAFVLQDELVLEQEAGLPVLRGAAWLAPFEQNLEQALVLRPRREPEGERWHFDLDVTRQSGPEDLWRRSNHALVDGIRKQMLVWRALDDAAVKEYVAAGEAALAGREVAGRPEAETD